ncbi:plexin-A4-like isoform X2 [Mizuhopecten yessoensis]|uniref:Hepatocyte growth factor receptor n=1 Tax=Mizuhopecten yessoensis TaxID=6573 RepID=A0A210QWW1_MIZYE|nr:plexin-A4-like isoform X2 [Mizuhopecten yessoensis]OWF53201.1 Plexin-A4 [Mizuhopecten yessoensis]
MKTMEAMPLSKTLVCLLCLVQTVTAMHIVHTFRDLHKDTTLQNLKVDKNSGDVFVGATNALYRFSPDLSSFTKVAIGPRVDNPHCPPPMLPCNDTKKSTNSFSEGIAIDYKDNTLISCISLFHGTCQIRQLQNISWIVKELFKPSVPNNPVKSSLVFIAPGVEGKNALYIGASYSNLGNKKYRALVPHISSRNLETLDFSYVDSLGGTKISILPEVRLDIPVEFLYGFPYGGFVYFIARQYKSAIEYMFVTKIIRICQSDKYFSSYTEIELTCQPQYDFARGAYYDESTRKLYVVFENNEFDLDGPSAVCGYNMAETERIFNLTVEECFNGDGNLGPSHIRNTVPCPPKTGEPDYCGSTNASRRYGPIQGRNPIFQTPIMEFPNTVLTSVAVTTKNNQVLLFLGTKDGTLKKVIQSPGNIVSVVQDLEIEVGQLIKNEIHFNRDLSMLYVITDHKLVIVDIRHCEEKVSCEECTASPDPVCGWCVMENRCLEQESCPSSAVYPHWLPAKQGACARMVEVQPHVLSYEKLDSDIEKQQITFRLEEIMLNPRDSGDLDLLCYFSSQDTMSKTAAQIDGETVTCPLPSRPKLPVLPEDYTDVQVEFLVGGRAVVKRSVPVFDCRPHQNCTTCTMSNFTCEWHHDTNSCSRTGSVTTGAAPVTNVNACPMIDSPSLDTDIVVHSGESKQIAVGVANLQPDQTTNIKCNFQYLNQTQVVVGTIRSTLLTCDPVQFSFLADLAYVTAKFKVTWGSQDFPLDNPRDITVRIYKCNLMVTNCGQCLSMDAEYECGWCGDECSLQKNCDDSWLDRSSTCPNPKILRFNPSTGPIQGKTNISVTGINLGKAYTDLQGGVQVAGVRCTVHPEHFEPSIGFRCETEPTQNTQVGKILVNVDNQYTTESEGIFAFVDPTVDRLRPEQGPKSGGTRITITGMNLDTGTKTTVDMGGSPCDVRRRNATILECITSQHIAAKDEVEVEVSFGGYKRLLRPKFTYVEDPTITAIEPTKSILSGGITLTVIGERLGMIQRPKFFVEVNDQMIPPEGHRCHPFENYMNKWLLCQTPPLNFLGENVTETNPREVHYGFSLDGVTTWRNISKRENMGPLLYYPDPLVERFSGKIGDKKYIQDKPLIIEGRFAGMSQLINDVKVVVGQNECLNPMTSETNIVCDPPENPDGINTKGNALVLIKIGFLRKDVGFLNYIEKDAENGFNETEKPIALGIILGVVLPIIAIITLLAICIIRRQRKNGPNKNGIPEMLKDYDGKNEEADIGLNHVSVKADMNGQIPDSGPYISELLARIEDEAARQSISDFLIPRSKLDIGELVGKGVFGNTYQANYTTCVGADSEEKKTEVAVKSLLGCNTDNATVDAFLQKCLILKDLQHPNILPLLGMCLSAAEEPHMVIPYLERGDLKTYVRDPSKNITVIQLLEMAQQISEAMVYLESLHVVHGDLAARNCLLTDDKVVRVAGFGVTDLYAMDYCKSDEDRNKTVTKWVAPEAINTFVFSHKTDVWSYGVLLWELLTRGVTPYPDVDSKDLKNYLEGGHHLKKPRQCPESLYVMMVQCWTDRPNDRPTFQEVNDDMKTFLSADNGEQNDDTSDTQPLKSNIEPGGSSEYLEVMG